VQGAVVHSSLSMEWEGAGKEMSVTAMQTLVKHALLTILGADARVSVEVRCAGATEGGGNVECFGRRASSTLVQAALDVYSASTSAAELAAEMQTLAFASKLDEEMAALGVAVTTAFSVDYVDAEPPAGAFEVRGGSLALVSCPPGNPSRPSARHARTGLSASARELGQSEGESSGTKSMLSMLFERI
jgi:hypothetical protein